MQELIDRYATMDAIPAPTDADEAEYYGKVCDAIEAMPTIEPEVRHGRWENGECTNCKRNLIELCGGEDYELAMYAEYDAEFCPFCGARMYATDTNDGGKGGEQEVSEDAGTD